MVAKLSKRRLLHPTCHNATMNGRSDDSVKTRAEPKRRIFAVIGSIGRRTDNSRRKEQTNGRGRRSEKFVSSFLENAYITDKSLLRLKERFRREQEAREEQRYREQEAREEQRRKEEAEKEEEVCKKV